jgi:ABC-type dipeptide/oligopeptide/nickel transport system permease component
LLIYAARRLLQALVVLFVVLTLVFLTVNLIGDPVLLMVPADATPDQIRILRESLGYNDPLMLRYLRFIGGAVTGDFGDSLWMRQPALGIALGRYLPSLVLGLTAMVIAVVIGPTLGVVAVIGRRGWMEQVVSVISFGAVATVEFWAALILIYIFAVKLALLPTSGLSPAGVIMPAIVVSLAAIGRLAQFTMESLKDEMAKPYSRAAIARGVPRWRVVTIHSSKNIAVPLVTLFGNELIAAVSSVTIIEVVFAWPGEGQLLYLAIQNRDLPLVVACVFIFTVVVVVINFIVDMLYGVLDRRARIV